MVVLTSKKYYSGHAENVLHFVWKKFTLSAKKSSFFLTLSLKALFTWILFLFLIDSIVEKIVQG